MIEVEGIIISEKSYMENSKLINILTKDLGIVNCIAKGAKTIKSDLHSVTSILTYAKFQIIYKKDKLSIITNADIINNFKLIKKDIIKISYATFLIDLAVQVYRQNEIKEIYELLITSILKIEANFDPSIISNIVELKFLNYLGVAPIFDCCSGCGSKEIITLSSSKGGYVCKNCLDNDYIVSSKTLKLVKMLYLVDLKKVDKIEVKKDIKKELNDFIDSYYERFTGLYVYSKKFLEVLNN